MFKNYFKTSYRNLMKNPLSSFINLFGLSMAIGVSLMVYAFMEFEHNIDRFHENRHEVYLATFFSHRDGTSQQYGMTPTPLGEMLKEDFAHIKKVCRVEDRGVVIKYEDHVFHEQVRFSDPEFLEMFTFPLKWGSSSSLSDMNSIILSEEMSIKYFGQENPIGRSILMKFGEKKDKSFVVTGVAKAFPKAHVIDFNFLINFDNFQVSNPEYDLHNWGTFVNATLIQVDHPSDLKPIEKGMSKYKLLQNEADKDWSISSFTFEPLATLYEKSEYIRSDISPNSSGPGRLALPIIAVFMLTLACFNYINIATVSAAKRLKEIGVRKVIGASRSRVISQFLIENIFVTSIALVLGLILAIVVLLPWFSQISSRPLDIQFIDKSIWIFLSLVLFTTGITSGLYPAFYISKFEPVTIFKGSVKFGKKNPLTKIFLSVQLILACILITGAITYTQNAAYQATRSWGYNQNAALYTSVPDLAAFERLNAAMIQDPNVLSVAGSRHHLGSDMASVVIHMPDRQYAANQFSVDASYFKTMELQLKEGRVFYDHHGSDEQAVVVNELLVKNLALENPIGQVFEMDSATFEIIGVVKDFHTYNFYYELLPTVFKVAKREDYRYLSMRVVQGSEEETFKTLKAQWAVIFPEDPFQGGHQVDLWYGFFEDLDIQQRFTQAVAFIAMLLASLGLYGLVTLNVSGRIREFSIRKVLGAGLRNIGSNVTKQYVILTVVALFIGAPVSYFLIKAQISTLYAYPMPMDYSGVTVSLLILIFVLLSVVSIQVGRVLKSNPVDGLKVE